MTHGLLRNLPVLARVGLSGLMLVLLMGMGASAAHLVFHDANRDESPRFTMDDVRAAYHGLDRPSAMEAALERGHPETLSAEHREVLLRWVRSGRVSEDHDSIDLGSASPSEIMASSCMACHGPAGKDPRATAVRLAPMEALKRASSAKRVNVTPVRVVAMSMHTHATTLGMLGVLVGMLAWLTRMPRGVAGAMIAVLGIGMAADFVCWWWARSWEPAVWGIVVGGAAANGMLTLMAAVVIVDAWWMRRRP